MKKLFVLLATLLCTHILSSQELIEVSYERKQDNSVEISYKKSVPGSYYVILEFNRLENCHQRATYEQVIKSPSGVLLTLQPANPSQGINFSYSTRYIFGNPRPKVNNKITYALPIKSSKGYTIYEAGNVGEKYFGSDTPIDWKSFSVRLKAPDTIQAMRKGKVVKITNKYNFISNYDMSYSSKRNDITIEHKDGTYAIYQGFEKDKIFVQLGQDVYPYTPLGLVGKFTNDDYRLDFNTYHYMENLMDNTESTLSNQVIKTKYLNPYFYVNGESQLLKSGESYQASYNEEIKLQEFSKKEKRRYNKNPMDFK